ncbi:MAG: NADH-quinone oxidoreductase subunit N [Deltaproteobacteria bacterium]|nr:NADH-quinone oxidoreductase subunit N [Deltaproteobacteria bacterium]
MQSLDNIASLWYFLPEFLLTAVFVLIFLVDLPKAWSEKRLLAPVLAALGLAGYIGLTVYSWDFPKAAAFHGMIVIDPFTNFFRIFGAVAGLVTIYFSLKAKELSEARAEYWAILLGIVIGMPMLAASNNLLMIYLAMELVSILSYIMVGYLPNSRKSAEAALKYVLYGATASGIMIYGLSLIFGVTGTLDAIQIRHFLEANPAERATLFVGLLMAFAGFGYKISAVPFHMWAPDVYEGAPTPVTAFLSVGPKAAGFAIVLRFIYTALTQPQGGEFIPLKFLDISDLLSLFAIATMVLGNLLAIQQKNIKRFLAYSSIAHAGYMLMAAAAMNVQGIQAVLFYLITYLIMNFGAFGVAILVQNELGTEDIEGFKGLAKRGRWALFVSLAMAMFLFSLTGLPPFIGFVGKFYLFAAVLEAKLYVLALIGVLNSVVSLYYYARVAKFMFFDDPADERTLAAGSRGLSQVLMGLAAATLVFGLFWKSLALISQSSANLLL